MPRCLSTRASAALLLALACDHTTGGNANTQTPTNPEPTDVALAQPPVAPAPLSPPPTAATPPWRKQPPVPGKPAGYEAPLSDAATQNVQAALEQDVGVPVTVRASLDLREVSPNLGVWIVYDYNPYQQCLLTRSEDSCFEEFGGGQWSYDWPRDRVLGCTRQWLARATFGDNWVELTARTPLNGNCVLEDVRHFELVDLDSDQQFEIYLDISGHREIDGFLEGSTQDAVSRVVKVLRLDTTIQFDWRLSTEIYNDANSSQAKRFTFIDQNGDGHLDLAFENAEYLGTMLAVDHEFWPIEYETDEDEDEDGDQDDDDDDLYFNQEKPYTYLYDPIADTWILSRG